METVLLALLSILILALGEAGTGQTVTGKTVTGETRQVQPRQVQEPVTGGHSLAIGDWAALWDSHYSLWYFHNSGTGQDGSADSFSL